MLQPLCAALVCLALWTGAAPAAPVRLAVFEADVTPPLGTPLCAGGVLPAQRINDPLGARGIVLLPEGQAPIVLCAVDWVGIANSSHDAWRQALADAAGTTRDRVSVHTLHQHDAPFADDTTDALLKPYGMAGLSYDPRFADKAIRDTAEALKVALPGAVTIDAIGTGEADVEKVASNRRVLGEDGKVLGVRWTACTDPELRAAPEGTIDPKVKMLSFWHGDTPVVGITFYATHPQSFYNTGAVSADFVGMARQAREKALGFPQIHFDGAGGNVGSGKYNDGAPENRPVLAGRLEDGMRRAWKATKKAPLDVADVAWKVDAITLPRRSEVDEGFERERLKNEALSQGERIQAAREIAWIERAAQPTEMGCLSLGDTRLLLMPGELFVEYQLAAQQMDPKHFVCMAAYSDYGPGYIGTAIAYTQGGYEPEVYTSRTAPAVEAVLMAAMHRLLGMP